MKESELIRRISEASDKNGDKLVEYMNRYNLHGLYEATEETLIEFISEENIT